MPVNQLLERIASPVTQRIPPRVRSHAWEAILLLALVGLFTAAYSMALREPAGSDDCSYFEYASGKMAGAAHHRQRYVLLATTWLSQAVFGYTGTAYYAVSFSYSLGLVLVSYVLARSFAGPLLSFMAAGMVLALPDFLENASVLMPDVPGQFWLVLGLVAFLRFFSAEPGSRPFGWAILSSVAFFCAASVKESLALALLGLICFPLAFARSKERWLRFAYVAGGVAALEAAQTLVLWAVFGDPLHRLHSVSSGHLPQMEMYASTPGYMPAHIDWSHLATRFAEGASENPAYAAGPWPGYWVLLALSLPLALGAAIWRRDRLLLAFAPFVFAAYATLTFPIVSLDPLIPVVRTIGRYFLVVLTLLPILVVAGFSHVWRACFERAVSGRWRLAVIACFVGLGLAYTSAAYASAAHFLSNGKRLIENGGRRVARTGESVRRYVLKHPEIQRVLGPKLIRGGGFTWGLDVEVRGMKQEQLRHLAKRRHDLVLDEEPALVMNSTKLAWRQVGESEAGKLVHLVELEDDLSAGEWEALAMTEKALKRAPRTRLAVRLEVQTDGVKLAPLELVTYGKQTRTLERMTWKRQGNTYTIDLESKPFRTRGLKACSFRLRAKGRGTFEIRERDIEPVP